MPLPTPAHRAADAVAAVLTGTERLAMFERRVAGWKADLDARSVCPVYADDTRADMARRIALIECTGAEYRAVRTGGAK